MSRKRGVEVPRTRYLDNMSDQQVVRFEGKRQWLGYRQVDINLLTISNENLVDYVMETGIYCSKPKRVSIPSQILERYHIDGLFFKIYNEQWGIPPGMCHCVISSRLSEELMYSESYTEIMKEVRKKGLLKRLIDLEKKRQEDWKNGAGFKISFADSVNSPTQEVLHDQLRAINEAQRRFKENPPNIIFGAAANS